MADAIVSFAIERAGDYLNRQDKFLPAEKGELESLMKELERLHSLIDDAQKKQINDSLIRQWLLDVSDIANDCEDVLEELFIKTHDEGILDSLSVDQATTLERRKRLFTCLKKISCCISSKAQEQVDLYDIGKQIEGLKGRFDDVSRRSELYNLRSIQNKTEGESSARDRLKTVRRIPSFQQMNVVGFEDDTRTLLAHLLDKNKLQRSVISIFGMGGLGKTALAEKLYHHPEIKNNFSHRAWVFVSQDYDAKDLLTRFIYSFSMDREIPELDKQNEALLERYLHRSLKGHSYLVVIDDIWHKEAWDCLKRAFPDENNGSRVIMTTRNRDIAQGVDDSTFPYALRCLTSEESWQLFCMNAFRNSRVDLELEKLGMEMVQKCYGLPLAIVVLGGLLATKKQNEWSKIRDNIWKHVVNHKFKTEYLLDLSFDDLPSELKVCFLYLGLFPEDYEIKAKKLIRLWVAEGFISQKGEKTMEELAEDNLNRLIDRSLIQTGLTSRGRIFTCRVHYLLRDLAIQKAKELNFFCTKHDTEYSAESSTSRRHAFYVERNTPSLLQHFNPLSRSLLFFGQYNLSVELPTLAEDLLQEVCKGFRLVRVLEFNNCHFQNSRTLPEAIGKLFHLKYLGLRNTSILNLPSSIGNLLNLQTLDLPTNIGRRNHLQIPSEICMLTELRHLIGHFDTELPIDDLTKLQTLKNVHGWVWTQVTTEKLVNLRELKITSFYDTEKKEFTFDSIANLKNLRILSIALRYSEGIYFGSLEPLSDCKHLQDLNLEGKMQNLPENLHELVPNLECLSLDESDMKDDPMPKLEKLLKLTHLQLGFNSYQGCKMTCSANGFPQLEILSLCPGSLFAVWEVEEGALPALKDLKIVVHPEVIPPTMLSSINSLKLSAPVHVERSTICRL